MSSSSFPISSVEQPLFPVKILPPEFSQALSSLIDSGADANIINEKLAGHLGIGLEPQTDQCS